MLSLYEILKASKTGIAPDMWTALAGMNWGSADSGHEVKELTGIPPLSIRSNGTMLLDYLISGNMEQTGTPSPQNPVMPNGTGDRTGQIIEYPYYDKSGSINGVLWTVSENGHIKGVGTTTSGTNFFLNRDFFFKAGTYTLKIYGKHTGMIFRIFDSVNSTIILSISSSSSDSYATFTLNADTSNGCRLYFNIGQAGVSVDIDCDIMLNTGSTALPYEPYGIKIPISSANTTTPVYLGEVESTRRIKKIRLVNPSSRTTTSKGYTRLAFNISEHLAPVYSNGGGYCNIASWQGDYNKIGFVVQNSTIFITQDIPEWNTLEGVTEWLNSNEVYVWYVLATPTTGIVNEPLREIGDYADTISYEQAGVQIPTNRGNTVIDVETTLKPSEVYIKYKG